MPDSAFIPDITSFSNVKTLVLQTDGKVIVSGSFTSSNGSSRNLIRLNSGGDLDNTFTRSDDGVYAVVVQPDNKILLGGFLFYNFNGGGGFGFNHVAVKRISTDNTEDNSFFTRNGYSEDFVEKVAVQPNGKILLYGAGIDRVGTLPRQGFARLNSDGIVEAAFNPQLDGVINTVEPLPDNKILIGGYFSTVSGVPRSRIAKLNEDGSVDANFNPGSAFSGTENIKAIVIQTDGKVVIGGEFNAFNNLPRRNIARLNADGTLDTSFNAGNLNIQGSVNTIALQTDGKILIGGNFTDNSTFSRHRIMRLNTDGTIDGSFAPAGGANKAVYKIGVQPGGKIVIGGLFDSINGVTTQKYIARLNADRSFDSSFLASVTHYIYAYITDFIMQRDGKIVIGGEFDKVNGITRVGIARLNSNGSTDLTFDTGSLGGNSPAISTMAQQRDGKILIGGDFTGVGGLERRYFARLLNSTKSMLFDYDGDGRADVSVFRPTSGAWYISNSSNNAFFATNFGQNGDIITPADFDGDGRTDICVFRQGFWYRLNSSNGQFVAVQFGAAGDLPVTGDFDGDGKADLSVFRPSNGTWYRVNSSNNQFVAAQFGQNGDKPQVADFDGDGKADLAVFRPANGGWYYLRSSDGSFVGTGFGQAGDVATTADFDGDSKADIAVFRPSNGTWYRLNSSNNQFVAIQFGISEDAPVAADYDGDGRADIAVFRPSNGTWYLLRSTAGFIGQQFGTNGDTPAPSAFGQ